MAKKHKHPEHENLERWLVSYADFITLLFATFTALYAIATADLAKMKDVTEAISSGFSRQSLMNGIQSVFQGKSAPTENVRPISRKEGEGDSVLGKFEAKTEGDITPIIDIQRSLKATVQQVNHEIKQAQNQAGQGGLGNIEVVQNERGISVRLDSRLLFDSGSAALKPSAIKALEAIAVRLRPISDKYPIHVEGHTDSLPIFSAMFPSNWELSTARAASVVRHLDRKFKFPKAALVPVGYADTKPIAPNSTVDGRAKNRRIEIQILTNEALQTPGMQPAVATEASGGKLPGGVQATGYTGPKTPYPDINAKPKATKTPIIFTDEAIVPPPPESQTGYSSGY